ncbi:MAG: HAD-IA family hydrolase [Candidatus Latescibacteria bacterium]|nr:HAD-IA family hydrolase [Candidatus Latescibacterota bacterium]
MVRVLLFDLCDTLVRTAGVKALLNLPGLEAGHDEASLTAWFQDNPVFFAYEKGQVTTEQFLATYRRLGVTASPTELVSWHEALILHEIDGMPRLLQDLYGRYPLYVLSNNNPLLWRGIQRVSPSLRFFQDVFLSHRIGLLKPDPAAFHYALEQMRCPAGEVVLIDDNPQVVAAARALGMGTVHFATAEQARAELGRLLAD